jgi:hypothetical protein
MEILGYAGHTKGSHQTRPVDQVGLQASEATPTPLRQEKAQAIGEEITKLLDAGFIREVCHPEWLANPILVKKKNGK